MFGKKQSISEEQVLSALRTVQEPDLHRDLVTLNMIKNVTVCDGNVRVAVELTTPACPLKEVIERDVTTALKKAGAEQVKLNLTANTRGPATQRRTCCSGSAALRPSTSGRERRRSPPPN